MYVPFISSVLFFIHMVLFVNNVDTLFFNINADLSGHSILWLIAFLGRSKKMCIWYKLSIKVAILSHVFNFMYYKKFIDIYVYMNLGISIAIISLTITLFFIVTYRAGRTIHSACKHLERK